MKYTRGKKENGKIKVDFELDAAEWEAYVEKAYQKDKAKYKKEGFRQGKVPRKVLEGTYGESIFYETAFDIMFPAVYGQMHAKEADIEAVDYPEIDVKKIGKDGVKFSAEIVVYPDVVLGAYTGLEVKTEKPKVLAEEVKAELDRLAERNARFEEKTDRAAKLGDLVEIDYSGSADGKKFEGGTAKNQELELGSHSFIPGFEEGVVGMKIGETKNIDVEFPKEYHAKELAGKPAVFEVKLNSIREKVLPEINDEFAKEVSEKETLADLKADIKERLLKQKKDSADIKVENDLVKKIVDNAKVEIPAAMVERQLDYFVDDFAYRLQYQGLRFEDYLKYIGKTIEEYRAMRKEEAEQAVKTNLVLDAIIRKEKITCTDEEAEKHFEEHHSDANSKKSTKIAMTDEQLKSMKNHIISEKLVEFVKKNNKVVSGDAK